MQGLIGYFVNPLALCVDMSDGGDGQKRSRSLSFVALLRRVRDVVHGAFAHAEVPFHEVVRSLGVHGDGSRTPLFQAMLAFNEFSMDATTADGAAVGNGGDTDGNDAGKGVDWYGGVHVFGDLIGDVDLSVLSSKEENEAGGSSASAKFELDMGFGDGAEGSLHGSLGYSTELFEAATMVNTVFCIVN